MVSATWITFALFVGCAQALKGSETEFIATMKLTYNHTAEAFDIMDMNNDQKIDASDLALHYYHAEADFAKTKFITVLNKNGDDGVCKDEFSTFLKKQALTNAVWECTYIISKTLRLMCFADQITTYVYLMLDDKNIESLFQAIDVAKDKEICIDDVKKMSSLNSKFTDKEAAIFMTEIGGADGKITLEELTDYLSQEDLLDDFRACAPKVYSVHNEYDVECMKKELIDWTMNHFTEKDSMATFKELEDDSDNDIDITLEDIKKAGSTDDVAAKFIRLMDHTMDGKVSYAEFRIFARSFMVRLHLERDCASKKEDQNEEVQCYKAELLKRVAENHTPIWFNVGDLDMLFLFEELDKTNDGKITVDDDLVKGHGWKKEIADKMVKEMDGPDDDNDVSMDEFNGFVDWPNIVYGIGDCQSFKREPSRIKCYNDELKKNIDLMLEKAHVDTFFHFYDKDGSGHLCRKEVEGAGVKGEDVQNFLDEVGMGDDTITYDELKWYGRQQDLSEMFKAASSAKPEQWHMVMVVYMENNFTQYDTQLLFDALDTDDDWELTDLVGKQSGGSTPEMQATLKKMDGGDPDKTVNFIEFWIYLHTPIGDPRKKHLEEKCTNPHEEHAKEMECYQKEIAYVG